ncbi:transcription factor bHLH68-like isoform X1 [Juglans microcarpa x Juglans regia]|uniref:transcription factor bHLH68-like isoform X1 n=2 Tax=Juglans microcarpa x Juglans regia TaxID=2249226 RepID=UPI001B7E5FB8|nr:transcription factor bHLH68-like isoform X1 [Juglans microcarpa x Juglans regia]
MNRGVLQSSPVQQMMAGNPNWWNINGTTQPSSPFLPTPASYLPQYAPTSSSSSSSSLPIHSWHDSQELPESWSQLLLGGLVGEEDKLISMSQFQPKRLMENWEDPVLCQASKASAVNVKKEHPASSYMYGNETHEEFEEAKPNWSQVMPAASSPKSSCLTSLISSKNMLDFSSNYNRSKDGRLPPPDRSSDQRNSNATGGAPKKARIEPSSTQTTFKVRKEKLGDRITALHQLVSPFGKTDTASVLLEALGYIRFLQSQIEALSLPYFGSGSGNMRQQHYAQGDKRNCIFPEDPGQLLNDNCIKRKEAPELQDLHKEPKKDLRSRGLCLIPVSCTLQVGSDNGVDYWAPALGGGF